MNHEDTCARTAAQREYAEGQLEGLLAQLACSGPGLRNAALNNAALQAGHYVGSGSLDRAHTERALLRTARAIGLRDSESRPTIRSGLDAGAKSPAFANDSFGGATTHRGPPLPDPQAETWERRADEIIYQSSVDWLVRKYSSPQTDTAAYLASRGLPTTAADMIHLPEEVAPPAAVDDVDRYCDYLQAVRLGIRRESDGAISHPRHRIGFVWRNADGTASTLQWRTIQPREGESKALFARGRKVGQPWGAHRLLTLPLSRPIAIVEGVLDALAWETLYPCHGAAYPIALSSARPLDQVTLAMLARRDVYVALDSDPAGESAATRILEQLAPVASAIRVRPRDKDWADTCARLAMGGSL